MMDTGGDRMRLTAWWEAQNIRPQNFLPLAIVRDEDQIRVQINGRTASDQGWLAQLSEHLSSLWGIPVTFEDYPWPADPVARILAIWQITGTRLGDLVGAQDLLVDEKGHIVCQFPSPIVEGVFRQWGGVSRLKAIWPDLPEWHQSIRHEGSIPNPLPEPVTISRDVGPKSIGQGIPKRDPISLDRLPSSGTVIVQGQIVVSEPRTGRDGTRHFSATLTDHISAVKVRASDRRREQPIDETLFKVGNWLKVAGAMEVDKFSGEAVIRIRDAAVVDGPTLEDGGTRTRVELHNHSKMSALDGVASIRDLFMLAKSLGHDAVTIVDHGVIQTYPEAEQLSRKTGIKAIFGVEAYMVEDSVVPLSGPPLPAPLMQQPIVVVDVETTGLSPRVHDIIEIGAVKVVGRAHVETFHRMVRPSRAVSRATQEITGITPQDLTNASEPEEVFRDFLQFAEGAVIAAHNAPFDMGFLRQAIARCRLVENWDVPVIDTLTLARVALPGLKGYGLGPLSKLLKIPLSQHHRALADAEATGHLLIRLLYGENSEWDEDRLRQRHSLSHKVGRPTPVVLLLRDPKAIPELYELISTSHVEYYHRVPRVPRSLIEAGRGRWWIGSPVHGGEIQEILLRSGSDRELADAVKFYDYWEIAPDSALSTLAREEHLDGIEGVHQWTRDLIDLGRVYSRPVVAVSDSHYLRPEDRIFRDILAATAKGELHDFRDALHFRTSAEMEEELAWLPDDVRTEVIFTHPQSLADSIPVIQPVPEGLYAPTLAEAEVAVSQWPWQRARALYGDQLDPVVEARLEREIRSIMDNGYASIYYIAHRLVKKSLDDGYLVGSRGSVGSSLVAYLLDITEVNPLPPHYRCPQCRYTEFVTGDGHVGSGFDLPHMPCPSCQQPLIGDGQDIPFETFLGFKGDKVPDIDLNFSGEYQPEIHRYTEVLFGQGHVFRAGTIATVAEKTAFGLVRAWAREMGRDLTVAEIEWLAMGITGVKRTTGQHPGGLMVVPADDNIFRFTPVQRPADDATSQVTTTHFDYHAIEGRLLKLDLLGHDDPTAIRMLEELTGVPAHQIPFQDEQTMSLFRSLSAMGVDSSIVGTPVGSLGIPEFGTRFVRGMLVDTKPETFAELVRISGLSHGTEVWTNNAQDIIRQRIASLSDVIATRDDIMLHLIAKGVPPQAAFGISESVRKGKGLNALQEQEMREHGIPAWYIDSCRKISYLFPKAHAAAYVMMGWRIAWYKVHHPLAFYATYFSVRAADFDPSAVMGGIKGVNRFLAETEAKGNEATAKDRNLVTVLEIAREMMARGFGFLAINLEQSDAVRFLIQGQNLLIPFASIPGLGSTAAQNIIEARSEAPFLSVEDLRQRAKLSKSVIELLRSHGALGDLGETSQLAFF